MPPKILLIADWYLPGYKAGGVITALANLVDGIGDDLDLAVITRDRDLTDTAPYAGVVTGEWIPVGKARVLYTNDLSLARLRNCIAQAPPDIVYLNSFFSVLTMKTLALRKLGLIPRAAFAIAPRGEFSPGALNIKALKKSIYAAAALRAGLYDGLLWHATSAPEANEVGVFLRAHAYENPRICAALDLPSRDWLSGEAALVATREPKTSPVSFLFLSRVSPIKNLLFVLDALASLPAPAELHIYGPIDDPDYWTECQHRIAALPRNIRAVYHGAVPRERVPSIFRTHDFFLLPTQGENFGYVVLESLAAGCPVVISDRTPWHDLQGKEVGWTHPLEARAAWVQTLTRCAEMDEAAHALMSRRARDYVQAWVAESDPRRATIEMFRSLVDRNALPKPSAAIPENVTAATTQPKSI